MSNAASPFEKAPNQGVMERRDPVPAGRYWIYIDEQEVPRWQAWVKASQGKVKPIVTEPQKSLSRWVPAVFQTRWDLDVITSIVGYWILFDVTEPVAWVGLGYPTTVIDPAINSAVDISTAPEPEPEWNPLAALFGEAKTLIVVGLGLYVAVQAVGLAKATRPRRRASA